jgi:hypothetical protein
MPPAKGAQIMTFHDKKSWILPFTSYNIKAPKSMKPRALIPFFLNTLMQQGIAISPGLFCAYEAADIHQTHAMPGSPLHSRSLLFLHGVHRLSANSPGIGKSPHLQKLRQIWREIRFTLNLTPQNPAP